MPRPETLEPSRLLKALTSTPAKPSELAKALGVSRATVHRKLEKLMEDEGVVVRVGEGPAAAYRRPTLAEELEKARRATATAGQVRLVMSNLAARAVQTALELHCRIGIGQFAEISSLMRFDAFKHADGSDFSSEELAEADKLADALKWYMLGLQSNASFGIYSAKVHPNVLRTWGLQRALRHRQAWDLRPQGSGGVAHDEPLGNDTVAGLFVHSEQPDEKGEPTRYIIEMPADCAELMRDALRLYLRIVTGDVMAVVDMARNQLLRHQTGAVVTQQQLDMGAQIAAKFSRLISGVESGAYNAELSPSSARILHVVKALEGFIATQTEQVCIATGEDPVLVDKVGDSPWAVSLDTLPPGMMLNYQRGNYRVIAPSQQDDMLVIVASSHSLKTALQMAKNYAEGNRGRDTSF